MLLDKKQICCSHIYKKKSEILLVIRTEDCFQFLCGGVHDFDEEPELIDVKDIIEQDPSIKYVLQLKKKHQIERTSVDDFWTLKYYYED